MKLKIFIIFLTILFLSSCGASKKTTKSKIKPTVVLLEPAPPKLPSVKRFSMLVS
jgi:PBP1b-binding outer membrane lipoprotein LpoB